ncbi:hypothetical protein DFJ58DRAFT_841086 [Suillus subalutaceus]|uniref:uncharacterized protein n=1 Tax=Suillus subalutaceus TaxID=48586 RepID=UPI001B87F9B5|nr:uncharacterized protein DFJ58DRAFT_841086 [Suillus subalutaceus]KAG1855658.1 hypothetical protein DFJ58DRAFT_841086 [Suillus subalutaceus]
MDSSYSDFQFPPSCLEPGKYSAAPHDRNMGVIPLYGQAQGLLPAAEKPGESTKLSKTAVVSALEAVMKQQVTELEKQLSQCPSQRDLMEVVAHQNITIQSIHDSCKKHLTEMRQDFEMKLADALQTVKRGHDDKESSDEDDEEEKDKDEARMEASLEAVIRHTFSHMLSTVKLTTKDLPWWPKDGEQWPVDGATNEKLLRFRWGESNTHDDNYRGLQTVFRYICAKGAEFSPGSARALHAISDKDLLDRVHTKYQDLQKALWAAKMLTPSRWLRYEGSQKCEVCEQKFGALPTKSEFKTDAFKTALISQLMSEDEDETNEEGRLRRYVSRPWVWASKQRNQFITAVDAQQDPHPPKCYTICTRVEHRARRWMVSQEWLAQPENQKYDVLAFIVDNGKAWGDPKDPEESISAQKHVKNQKKEVAACKRAKLVADGNRKLEKGKKRAQSKKDKGKARAINVDEEPTELKNMVPAQPVASTSNAHQMIDDNADSNFED